MLAEGYEVYPVADAVGGISPAAHERAFDRMFEAGSLRSPSAAIMRNWARGDSDNLRHVMLRLHKLALRDAELVAAGIWKYGAPEGIEPLFQSERKNTRDGS